MDRDPKKIVRMVLGFFDYLQDNMDELKAELDKRGEERAEDIRDFWDDVFENLSGMIGNAPEAAPSENGAGEDIIERETVLGGLLADLDIKGLASDLVDQLGLARAEEVRDLSEQIDRIGRAIENME